MNETAGTGCAAFIGGANEKAGVEEVGVVAEIESTNESGRSRRRVKWTTSERNDALSKISRGKV